MRQPGVGTRALVLSAALWPLVVPTGRTRPAPRSRAWIRPTRPTGITSSTSPAVTHLSPPPSGQGGCVSPLVTKTLVFLGKGSNVVGKQHIVLTVGWADMSGEYVALALP